MGKKCIVYRIDPQDRLVYLSEEWDLFANENRAGHLIAETILNRPWYEFVADSKCQYIYKLMINRSRESQRKLDFTFRCDSPDRRRYMSMSIAPLMGELIEFSSCIEREESRDPALILDVDAERSDELLVICSWCKKIKITENRWLEVEDGIDELGLFETTVLPQLSHGICELCYVNAKNTILRDD